ncbi:outer membrane protein transport protein [Psychrobacter sp.]|uniref:OmpP1/FadL family transporter n=1 Tax=Psychrobacter sp. TaxID=56811 RepID=UPI0025EFEC3C|nr:outer membrane protein transport protein [Psychrobacter sp.]
MRISFTIKPLVTAIATLSIASFASAAGLDRSGQPVTAFLQDGTYAESVYTYIDADVTGKDKNGNKISDIAESYDFFRYGVKSDINDTLSIGVLYDEPWGASANYEGNNTFVGAPTEVANGIIASRDLVNPISKQKVTNVAEFKQYVTVAEKLAQAGKVDPKDVARLKGLQGVLDQALSNTEGTNVEVRTESLTGLLGMKVGQNKEFQIYGGPVAQRLKADVKLRGSAYENATGYNLSVNPDTDYGWIAGVQYSKPEIALKAALTYRSEIDHNLNASEFMPLVALRGTNPHQVNKMQITTPESVNFDFQTGLNPTTLATAKVRWVPWSDFAITPPLYNGATKIAYPDKPNGLNLVDYSDDQWQVELGLGKRVADNLAVSGSLGWDSGAGDPTTSLGPIKGYYSVGLGAKYDFTKNWALSAGGKYLMFGDAKGKIPNGNIVGNFENNDGYALGVQLSYQDK